MKQTLQHILFSIKPLYTGNQKNPQMNTLANYEELAI